MCPHLWELEMSSVTTIIRGFSEGQVAIPGLVPLSTQRDEEELTLWLKHWTLTSEILAAAEIFYFCCTVIPHQ